MCRNIFTILLKENYCNRNDKAVQEKELYRKRRQKCPKVTKCHRKENSTLEEKLPVKYEVKFCVLGL